MTLKKNVSPPQISTHQDRTCKIVELQGLYFFCIYIVHYVWKHLNSFDSKSDKLEFQRWAGKEGKCQIQSGNLGHLNYYSGLRAALAILTLI